MNTKNSKPRDPTRLGTIEDVAGSSVRIKLEDGTETGLVFVQGEGYRVGQVGSFVRIPAGYTDIYGIVSQVGAGAAPMTQETAPNFGNRWLRVELVGEGGHGRKFERGISQYPTVGDVAHVVTESDLATIYAPGEKRGYISMGRVASAESIPAYLDLNKLITRHSAIVGSTGSGKSTTVASLLNSFTQPAAFPGSRIVLLDIHGEYTKAFGDDARVFRVNASPVSNEKSLHVPFWALTADELISIATNSLTGATLAQFLEHIADKKRVSKPSGIPTSIKAQEITSDTPLPFCIHKLWHDLHSFHYATHTVAPSANQSEDTRAYEADPSNLGQFLKGNPLKLERPQFRATTNAADSQGVRIYKSTVAEQPRNYIDALEARLRDRRLNFMFNPGPWSVNEDGSTEKDLDQLLKDWIGGDKPITVLDLSGIPPSVLDDLVGAVLRILFDSIFWGRNENARGRCRPLLIALEEAHAYLAKESKGRAAVATRRIAKEGRKYGVGMMLISQRPSEIDPTIFAQCGTMIAMRLTNETDRSQIKSCSSDNLEGLFSMLSILRTGEALVVGEAVGLPIRALVSPPPYSRRPDSSDPMVVVPLDNKGQALRPGGWKSKIADEDYETLVKCWRMQNASLGTSHKSTTNPKK